ncbi:MAG: peptidase, partial [Rhodanobacter sp.]
MKGTAQLMLLVLVVSGVLGVQPVDAIAQAGNASARPDTASRALKLDESKLTPLMRFDPSLLGDASEACKDFDAYANGKWLASNQIPGDELSWGSWD